MTYDAAIAFLYGLQKHGIKLGLETISTLLACLDHPQRCYPALHIAGTNGKGSTAAMAASMLQAAGHRVGLYTSPHLVDFTERIRVDGRPISQEAIAALTARLRHRSEAVGDQTFFEFTTALAFQYFADMKVDLAVLEVGLGGRFDATNVICPLVSAITTVSLDHQAYLGETVTAIALEKAGIIKPGVPVVLGRLGAEATAVIDPIAVERGAPCYRFGGDFTAKGDHHEFDYEGIHHSYRGLQCPLAGVHQIDNAACALALLELASERGVHLTERAVRDGLRGVQWEGRLEMVEHRPALVLDGAHNPAAAEAVAAYIGRHRREHPKSRVVLVISIMRDKDLRGMLQALVPVADELILTQARIPRAATIPELSESLGTWTRPIHKAPSPAEALALARHLASDDDLICVTGSLMLVGDVKALLRGCDLISLRG